MSTLKSYITGFVFSIVLTLAAYTFVAIHVNSGHVTFTHEFLTLALIVLAFFQAIVQLIFFLHLSRGRDAKWSTVIFLSTVFIILLVVVGSLWIMNHLNYNMTPQDMNTYMLKSEGINQ